MNMSTENEIFSEEDLKKNEERLTALIKLISSKQSILFAGAGCSINAGYPSWGQLIDDLKSLVDSTFQDDEVQKKDNPLAYVDKIKKNVLTTDRNLDRYFNKLQSLFEPDNKPHPYSELNKALLRLPFKGFITTNYDIVLENALRNIKPSILVDNFSVKEGANRNISHFFHSLDFQVSVIRIAHLHGIYNDHKNIILSEEDYKEHYLSNMVAETETLKGFTVPEWKIHKKFLWSLLATRKLVFVGFSFDDSYLTKLLDLTVQDLWRWDEPSHFAIIPISAGISEDAKKRAKNLREKYGVEVVFYTDNNPKHPELLTLIESIGQSCGISPAGWMDRINKKFDDQEGII